MSGHSTYQPQSAFMKWMERRLPIAGLIHSSFIAYPTPRNLNYWWTFGGILSFMLAAQIITGIVLVMHYTPHESLAFNSVEHIMRDVNYGWLLRYLHSNGASMFFIAVYIHMFRGIVGDDETEPFRHIKPFDGAGDFNEIHGLVGGMNVLLADAPIRPQIVFRAGHFRPQSVRRHDSFAPPLFWRLFKGA